MPADPEPPELARLLAFSERGRTGDWSLRSALVRYAQGEPQRVSDLLEVVRRIEDALHPFERSLRTDGPAVWRAMAADEAPADEGARRLVELLRATAEVDRLGDDLAAWADNRTGPRPDARVDEVTAATTARLDAAGVAREERSGPPPRRRG
ncbi:MAG: hypothetical protein ACSLFP_18325 [Acidimicrobiales bacterium]